METWHVIDIPMSDITTEVDLFEVSQLFQILGTTGPITGIEIDDVAFTGGGDPLDHTRRRQYSSNSKHNQPRRWNIFQPGR